MKHSLENCLFKGRSAGVSLSANNNVAHTLNSSLYLLHYLLSSPCPSPQCHGSTGCSKAKKTIFIIFVSKGPNPISCKSCCCLDSASSSHRDLFPVPPLVICRDPSDYLLASSRCLYPCPGFCDYLWKLYPFVDPEFKTIIFQQLQCQEMLQWRGEGPVLVYLINWMSDKGIFWMTPAVDCVMRLV